MCGHVGVAGSLAFKDELLIKRLLVFDYFRGPDSTGLAVLRKNGETRIAKKACNPLDLFDTKSFTEALNGHNSHVFLGHNRAATKGAVTNLNAHPFQSGNIIGAHNGTLSDASFKELKEFLGDPNIGTDSEAIIMCIDKIGIEETVKMLQGAWALVWMDIETKKLYFLRNEERTFWVSYSPLLDKIMWSSEWPILSAATKLSSTHTFDLYEDKDGAKFFPTVVNKLYEIDLKELASNAGTPLDIERGFLHGKPKEVKAVVTTNPSSPFRNGGTTRMTTFGVPTGPTEDNASILNIVGSNLEPLGEWIGRDRFDELSKYGCSFCGSDISYEDVGVSVYDRDDVILCPECTGNVTHSRLYVSNEDYKLIKECA